MGVESLADNQAGTELAAVQETLDTDGEIAFVDAVADEIETVIDEISTLQRFEYVVGNVSGYGASSNDHAYFDLVHNGCPLRCVIF